MSNKTFNQLWPADKAMRKLKPVGMRQGVDLTVELIIGFELFNTRPYHNYETWSNGYRVYDNEIDVKAEDLDEALALFAEAKKNPKPWQIKREE